jgi:hypothetical protein
MMPFSCAASSASQTRLAMVSASATGIGPRRIRSTSVSPYSRSSVEVLDVDEAVVGLCETVRKPERFVRRLLQASGGNHQRKRCRRPPLWISHGWRQFPQALSFFFGSFFFLSGGEEALWKPEKWGVDGLGLI